MYKRKKESRKINSSMDNFGRIILLTIMVLCVGFISGCSLFKKSNEIDRMTVLPTHEEVNVNVNVVANEIVNGLEGNKKIEGADEVDHFLKGVISFSRSAEENNKYEIIISSIQDTYKRTFERLNLTEEQLENYAISINYDLSDVYGVAIIKPKIEHANEVKNKMENYILEVKKKFGEGSGNKSDGSDIAHDGRKRTREEIANTAVLVETEEGFIVLVMTNDGYGTYNNILNCLSEPEKLKEDISARINDEINC